MADQLLREVWGSLRQHQAVPPEGAVVRHTPQRGGSGKPPKLRFKPGWFIRHKSGQLYEILVAYRVRGEVGWFFVLEERTTAETPVSQMSAACSFLDPSPTMQERVRVDPLLNHHMAHTELGLGRIYAHGSRITPTNKELLNEFTVEKRG